MASLIWHLSGVWRIRFRFGGRQYFRSLETSDEEEARRAKDRVEETIGLLARGRISLPEGTTAEDAGLFIMSGGRVVGKGKRPQLQATKTLKQAIDAYFDSLPENAKAASSLRTEKIHANHLLRILQRGTVLRDIGVAELQRYVNRRSREDGLKGKPVQPETIKKDLATFRQVRNFAKARGWVDGDLPLRDVRHPKADAKEPFQTWDQIERKIERDGLAEDEATGLWERLFLREHEVADLLNHLNESSKHPFVYPMFAFAALTGARRSELLRSEVDDFDFDNQLVRIREFKRKKEKAQSYRYVQLGARLDKIMREWFGRHPGGRYTICRDRDKPLTINVATYHFRKALKDSKWSVLRGFHILRHSFASICAMHGIPDSIIDGWMGHMTDEMRERYRHLVPEQQEGAMASLFDIGLFR